MEEVTSIVMDFNHHSACAATGQSTRVRPSLCQTYKHPNNSDSIVQHTSKILLIFDNQKFLLWNILISMRQVQVLESAVNVSEGNLFLV